MTEVVQGNDLLKNIKSSIVEKEDHQVYDIGNLTAYDPDPLPDDFKSNVAENLKRLARDNVQLLFNQVFNLESEAAEFGRLAHLPTPTTPLPRAKPVPKDKPLTKWEQFAKLKGIKKTKKTRMVWDEQSQDYKPRFGYKRANDSSQDWAVEHKEGDDPSVDPWTKMVQERKEKIQKNKKKQENNLRAAVGQRVPGTLDLTSLKQPKKIQSKKLTHVDIALATAQRSTASLGKHDRYFAGEPIPKRKIKVTNEDLSRSVSNEKQQNLKLLTRIVGSSESDNIDMTRAVNHVQREQENERRQRKQSAPPAKRRKTKQ